MTKDGTASLYHIHYKVGDVSLVSLTLLQGWNKTWDETVPEERLLKMTPQNLKMQKELQVAVKPERAEADLTKQKKAVELQPPSKRVVGKLAEQTGKGTKRPLQESDCKIKEVCLKVRRLKKSRSNSECSSVSGLSNKSSEEDVTSRLKRRSRRTRTTVIVKIEPEDEKREVKKMTKKKKVSSSKAKVTALADTKESEGVTASGDGAVEFGRELELELPEVLRELLVDDYDLISRQRKTLMIPARLCVADFLESFLEEERKTAGGGRGSRREVAGRVSEVEEVCRGLVQYLDASLGSALLYKFERVQYSDTVKLYPGVPLSKLYPPVHLLRLLTRLPGLLGADLQGVLPVLQALVGSSGCRHCLATWKFKYVCNFCL